jgi:phosphate starvation-inducible protein PhoH and related proteins
LADKSGKSPRGGGSANSGGSSGGSSGASSGGTQSSSHDASGSKVGPLDAKSIVTLADNRVVAIVLGEHDAHLALIEQLIGVTAVAHGNVITLTGSTSACAAAKKVLETQGMAQVRTRQKIVTARTAMQSSYIRALERSDLVFGLGPAGTGKTYLAVAFAAQCLERNLVEKIILSRPAVEAGERLGFLPGDMKEKVDPYLRPLYDALYDVLPREKVEHALTNGIIEIAPLAFMRGRTLANAAVILDEAQNTTSMQMKMGEGSKMIVTGDPTQIDLPSGQRSGLEEAVGLLGLVKGIETIRFVAADVVRRDLVARIVSAYEASTAATTTLPDRYLPNAPRGQT